MQQGQIECVQHRLNTFYNVTISLDLSYNYKAVEEYEKAELALMGAVVSGFQKPRNFCKKPRRIGVMQLIKNSGYVKERSIVLCSESYP